METMSVVDGLERRVHGIPWLVGYRGVRGRLFLDSWFVCRHCGNGSMCGHLDLHGRVGWCGLHGVCWRRLMGAVGGNGLLNNLHSLLLYQVTELGEVRAKLERLERT